MQIKPVAKLSVGSVVSLSVPRYDGVYRLQRCGDRVGIFQQPPSDSEPVERQFIVVPSGDALTFAARHHGSLEMPFFGWCDVYELYVK